LGGNTLKTWVEDKVNLWRRILRLVDSDLFRKAYISQGSHLDTLIKEEKIEEVKKIITPIRGEVLELLSIRELRVRANFIKGYTRMSKGNLIRELQKHARKNS
jgi:hypothetical protein